MLHRYLFNCGEGTQRLAHEHKMKLSKLEHVFITHSSWKNFGGLPGMCLTLQDSGVSEVVLHGPPQVVSTSARAPVNITGACSYKIPEELIGKITLCVQSHTKYQSFTGKLIKSTVFFPIMNEHTC